MWYPHVLNKSDCVIWKYDFETIIHFQNYQVKIMMHNKMLRQEFVIII